MIQNQLKIFSGKPLSTNAADGEKYIKLDHGSLL
jgi:hypothetical protein